MIRISTSMHELGDSAFSTPIFVDEIQSGFSEEGFNAENLERRRIKINPDYPDDITLEFVDPDSIRMIFISFLLADKSSQPDRPVRFLLTLDGVVFGFMTEFRLVNVDGFDKSIIISGFDNSGDAYLDIIIARIG